MFFIDDTYGDDDIFSIDTDELSLKRTHGKTELQESFSADLRETLLENIAQT